MLHKFPWTVLTCLWIFTAELSHAVDDVAYDIADLYPEMNADELAEKFADKYSREQIDEAVEELQGA